MYAFHFTILINLLYLTLNIILFTTIYFTIEIGIMDINDDDVVAIVDNDDDSYVFTVDILYGPTKVCGVVKHRTGRIEDVMGTIYYNIIIIS